MATLTGTLCCSCHGYSYRDIVMWLSPWGNFLSITVTLMEILYSGGYGTLMETLLCLSCLLSWGKYVVVAIFKHVGTLFLLSLLLSWGQYIRLK